MCCISYWQKSHSYIMAVFHAIDKKTIYLDFENERYLATVYLWLEVIATVPTIKYSMETY